MHERPHVVVHPNPAARAVMCCVGIAGEPRSGRSIDAGASPGADAEAGRASVPVQVWQRRAQSRRRCGSGEPDARAPVQRIDASMQQCMRMHLQQRMRRCAAACAPRRTATDPLKSSGVNRAAPLRRALYKASLYTALPRAHPAHSNLSARAAHRRATHAACVCRRALLRRRLTISPLSSSCRRLGRVAGRCG